MFLIDHHSLFKLVHRPHAIVKKNDLIFIYENKKIGILNGGLPTFLDINNLPDKTYCFGEIEGKQCLLWHQPIKELEFVETRSCYEYIPKDLYQAAAIGNHIYHFRDTHRYCGKCGGLVQDKLNEQALSCPTCLHIIYPKISPCVIVLITQKEKILLARSPHFKPNVMSTLAGFIGIGESAEQTILREVKEEVGIEVDNIQYISSQPWPFPDSLMLGYTAEWVKGEIQIDHHEIEKAGWFDKNNLPTLPNKMSIARFLIDHYLAKKL